MNLGMPEMFFIFLLALLIFGPKKLPEIGRQVGKGLTEFKRAKNEFQAQFADEVRRLELDEMRKQMLEATPPQGTVATGQMIETPDPIPAAPTAPAEPAAPPTAQEPNA